MFSVSAFRTICLTQRLKNVRIVLIAKVRQIQNQTFHTQAKMPTGPDSLLWWLEALLAMPFTPAPPSGFGVVSDSDSQVTVPCPPGKAATGLRRGPILLLPDSP